MTHQIRLAQRARYLTIPADIAQAPISLKAKGQLITLLAGNLTDQDDSAIKELRLAGYIKESHGSYVVVDSPEKKPAVRRTAIPEAMPSDWQPGPKALKYLEQNGLHPSQLTDTINNFRAYWISRQTKRADWDASFIRNPLVNKAIQQTKSSTTQWWEANL